MYLNTKKTSLEKLKVILKSENSSTFLFCAEETNNFKQSFIFLSSENAHHLKIHRNLPYVRVWFCNVTIIPIFDYSIWFTNIRTTFFKTNCYPRVAIHLKESKKDMTVYIKMKCLTLFSVILKEYFVLRNYLLIYIILPSSWRKYKWFISNYCLWYNSSRLYSSCF